MVRTYDNKRTTLSHEDIVCYNHTMSKLGIVKYNKRSVVRAVLGGVMVTIGISTLMLPTGSIPLIIVGSGLLGYDVKAFISKARYEIHVLKLRYLGWVL